MGRRRKRLESVPLRVLAPERRSCKQDGERYDLAKRAAIETIENGDELEVAQAIDEIDG